MSREAGYETARGQRTKHRILAAVQELRDQKGYAPTVAEVAKRIGMSSRSAANYHVGQLREQGFLAPAPLACNRALVLVRLDEPPASDRRRR